MEPRLLHQGQLEGAWRASSSSHFSKPGRHPVLPGAHSPRCDRWRWGRLAAGWAQRASLPSAGAQCIPADGLGTARRRPPPPPLSSRLSAATRDPNAPAPRSPQPEGDGSGPLPRQGTTVPSGALCRQRQRLEPERPRRRAKFAERGLSGHPRPPPRAPGSESLPAHPGVPDTEQPQGAPRGVSVCGWGRGGPLARAPPGPPRRLPQLPASCAHPSRPRSRANSWRGSWKPRRPRSAREPEEGEDRLRGGFVLLSSNSACRALARGERLCLSRPPRPPPRVHGPPRPAAGASLRARGRQRRGGRDTAWLTPPAARAPARTRTLGARESGPLPAGRWAPSSGLGPRPGSRATPWPLAGGGGRPLYLQPEKAPFRPARRPRHLRRPLT